MKRGLSLLVVGLAMGITAAQLAAQAASDPAVDHKTAEKCSVCHTKLQTASGQPASIEQDWSASAMANAARDPYWQGSVRRETVEHPEIAPAIENECASCHMPLQHLRDQEAGHATAVFTHLPLGPGQAAAADGVTCTVCHQMQPAGLGTEASYNGNFTVAGSDAHPRTLYGPFDSAAAAKMHAAVTGYTLAQSPHIRDSALCGSCHTLFTTSYGPGGKVIGKLPEQMPYVEWLHSSYKDKQSCQQCHMPAVDGTMAVSSLAGHPRDGARRHTFTGANFLLADMLSAHGAELGATASSAALDTASQQIRTLLATQAARLTVTPATAEHGVIAFAVKVENLTGHKLPTAFPSRRAWLHVTVTAADGKVVFESGKLNEDGSIAGNANDADPTRFSPHYTRITKPDEVQIFEPILGTTDGKVTTGLLQATGYLKDNRILPSGFDKTTAPPEIAIHGQALNDPAFKGGESTTAYAVSSGGAARPFHVAAELVYQPVGFRWAHNLAPVKADETQRFVKLYNEQAAHSSTILAKAEAQIDASK